MTNSFGSLFTFTTWGESHGPAIGVVVDGMPASIPLSEKDIQPYLDKRRPGASPHTSPRKESDRVVIESGVFEGMTTGAPIALRIMNRDHDPKAYDTVKNLLRPGHANETYLKKYGVFDHRGGGRASARETACRVAAGACAQKLLSHWGISITARVSQVGSIVCDGHYEETEEVIALLNSLKKMGDSIGGVVECTITNLPPGLGEPVYGKVEAVLASAMLSIPASKGFEIGKGFGAAIQRGSEHNDRPHTDDNNSGGTLGGITTGKPLVFKVPFKPTSSIRLPQETTTLNGESALLTLGANARHDPCVALRAPPIVQAMAAVVIADFLLLDQARNQRSTPQVLR